MSVKDTKAEVNTITYDKDKIEDKVGSIYEAIVIMGKEQSKSMRKSVRNFTINWMNLPFTILH
jgi:hypothetical protein